MSKIKVIEVYMVQEDHTLGLYDEVKDLQELKHKYPSAKPLQKGGYFLE